MFLKTLTRQKIWARRSKNLKSFTTQNIKDIFVNEKAKCSTLRLAAFCFIIVWFLWPLKGLCLIFIKLVCKFSSKLFRASSTTRAGHWVLCRVEVRSKDLLLNMIYTKENCVLPGTKEGSHDCVMHPTKPKEATTTSKTKA